MQRIDYIPAPAGLLKIANPRMIDNGDGEDYLGLLFTDHFVKSANDPKIRTFSTGAHECLKRVEDRRRGFKVDSILLGIAVLLFLWCGFAKADDFPTNLIITYIGLIFLVIGGVRLRNNLKEEKPGKLVYEIAAAWKIALPKFHDVRVVNQFCDNLRGRNMSRYKLYNVNKEITDILGFAFDARLRFYCDKFHAAETVRHQKNKDDARDMFARTDKAAQLLGFARADWDMLNKK